MVFMATTKTVKKFVQDLQKNECTCFIDWKNGTVEVKDGDITVYKALQKGKGQPWMVKVQNSQRVKFS